MIKASCEYSDLEVFCWKVFKNVNKPGSNCQNLLTSAADLLSLGVSSVKADTQPGLSEDNTKMIEVSFQIFKDSKTQI